MLDYERQTNLSYDANDFVSQLKNITQFEFFSSNVVGEYNKRFSMPFSPILTKYGFCFNFNLVPAESLLHLEK